MGIGWINSSVSSNSSNTNFNTTTNGSFNNTSDTKGLQVGSYNNVQTGTQTGTQTGANTYAPNLSDYWRSAYQGVTGAVNPGGATSEQQTAIDFVNNYLKNNSATGAANTANGSLAGNLSGLNGLGTWWNNQVNNGSYTLGSLAAKAAQGVPGYESYATPKDVSAQIITSNDALTKIPQYSQFYDNNLIDPSLKAYDYGTDRAFSALDARTAGGGGFANERSGLAYSDLGSQSALGRGQLYSGLKNLGLTNAAGLATGDVNRMLQADTTNAGNNLQAQMFNSNMLNNRQQFDVGAAYQGDQMRTNYATGAAANILQQAGVSQQILSNIMTADGININAAAALFQSGSITYGQLQAIVQAAQAANGGTTTNNQTSNQTSDQASSGTNTEVGKTTTNNSGTSTSNTVGNASTSGTNAKLGFGLIP